MNIMESGGIKMEHNIESFYLYRYINNTDYFILAVEVLYIIVFSIFTIYSINIHIQIPKAYINILISK